MSNPAADKDLTPPAARLALAAPLEWKAFLDGLRKYTDSRRDQLVSASLEEMQRAQGRAQQCVLLVSLCEDAVNAANRASAPAGKQNPRGV